MNEETLTLNIQRLADGELGENERKEMLHWIEQSAPCYWRDVSLAFVEAQMLSEASISEQSLIALPPLKRSVFPAGAKLAIAAALAIGLFAAGFLANSSTPDTSPPASSIAASDSAGSFPSFVAALPKAPTTSSPTPQAQEVSKAAAVLKQLNADIADSGYEASLMTRYVSHQLDDGDRIVIPVNKVIVRPRAE